MSRSYYGNEKMSRSYYGGRPMSRSYYGGRPMLNAKRSNGSNAVTMKIHDPIENPTIKPPGKMGRRYYPDYDGPMINQLLMMRRSNGSNAVTMKIHNSDEKPTSTAEPGNAEVQDQSKEHGYVPLKNEAAWYIWRKEFLDTVDRFNVSEEEWNREVAVYIYCKLQ